MRKFEDILKNKRLILCHTYDCGCDGYVTLSSGKRAVFVFSFECGWEHLSISYKSSIPTWDDMCIAKDIFFEKSDTCVQYHPAEADYVNVCKTCLHIWRPINELLPKPPKEMVY
jgi:hypothetical protein